MGLRGWVAMLLLAPCCALAGTPVYVNRCTAGCTFDFGPPNAVTNVSPLVASSPSSLSAFAHGDAVFDATVACIAQGVAAYDLQVVTVDPSPAPHLEVVMAGLPQEAGLDPLVGASTLANCVYAPNSTSFVFANKLDPQAAKLCEQALRNLGFTAGLEYLFNCPDVMSLLGSCNSKSFLDQESLCGTTSQRSCQCAASATRNSHRVMLGLFGAPSLFENGFE